MYCVRMYVYVCAYMNMQYRISERERERDTGGGRGREKRESALDIISVFARQDGNSLIERDGN